MDMPEFVEVLKSGPDGTDYFIRFLTDVTSEFALNGTVPGDTVSWWPERDSKEIMSFRCVTANSGERAFERLL